MDIEHIKAVLACPYEQYWREESCYGRGVYAEAQDQARDQSLRS
jgi:hypothetical protein